MTYGTEQAKIAIDDAASGASDEERRAELRAQVKDLSERLRAARRVAEFYYTVRGRYGAGMGGWLAKDIEAVVESIRPLARRAGMAWNIGRTRQADPLLDNLDRNVKVPVDEWGMTIAFYMKRWPAIGRRLAADLNAVLSEPQKLSRHGSLQVRRSDVRVAFASRKRITGGPS